MKQFPFVPLGEAVICKKLSTDMSRGGIVVPENSKDDKGESMVVCQIVACPEGGYTQSGVRVPPEVSVDDIVAMPMKAARKIGLALSDELIRRGVPEEEMKSLFVAFIPNIMGRFVAGIPDVPQVDKDSKPPVAQRC